MHAFADPWLLLHLACLQVFYTTHILGFIGFVLFGLMHYYNNWMVMVPGGWGGRCSQHPLCNVLLRAFGDFQFGVALL
jgi:hypothetical protein